MYHVIQQLYYKGDFVCMEFSFIYEVCKRTHKFILSFKGTLSSHIHILCKGVLFSMCRPQFVLDLTSKEEVWFIYDCVRVLVC